MIGRCSLIPILAVVILAGCADRFRPEAPLSATATSVSGEHHEARLRIGVPPPDLAWVTDALRLFEVVDAHGDGGVGEAAYTPPVRMSSPGGGVEPLPTGPDSKESSQSNVDLRFVTLPMTPTEAAGLATGPAEAA